MMDSASPKRGITPIRDFPCISFSINLEDKYVHVIMAESVVYTLRMVVPTVKMIHAEITYGFFKNVLDIPNLRG